MGEVLDFCIVKHFSVGLAPVAENARQSLYGMGDGADKILARLPGAATGIRASTCSPVMNYPPATCSSSHVRKPSRHGGERRTLCNHGAFASQRMQCCSDAVSPLEL